MAETWHTPMDWPATDYVVTPTDMNEQVRDNPEYLKGVLSGSSLQAVTIAAAQVFKYGSLRVLCGGTDERRHICGARLTLDGSGDISASFATAFASTPFVANSHEGPSDTQDSIRITTCNTTTIAFSMASSHAGEYVHYVAIGASS